MDLATQAEERSDEPAVQELAREVVAASSPLVDRLADLGVELAADGAGGFAHGDSDDHDTESVDRAVELRETTHDEFDAEFLRLLQAELDEGLRIAQAAQGSVTDSRTRSAADDAVESWTVLVGSVQDAA